MTKTELKKRLGMLRDGATNLLEDIDSDMEEENEATKDFNKLEAWGEQVESIVNTIDAVSTEFDGCVLAFFHLREVAALTSSENNDDG